MNGQSNASRHGQATEFAQQTVEYSDRLDATAGTCGRGL